ncbi:PH domain leucine-rich repeat-containing protein phosphatase 2-like isoform X2 [Corticium candelabrum]|uniref:PH domain leucine-rich repeat-containing protein phosphatase 2-like isoform X2 n=1 Tax=Corticium candelabrum TaxID=121492 RepID=UPI002E26CFA3|nr:PH domain leucine-rich repeat-containing protein phosphatase 2-like isoform X2 [Corticium candelabrum]
MKRSFPNVLGHRSLSSSPWWATDRDFLHTEHFSIDAANDFGSATYFDTLLDNDNDAETDNDQWIHSSRDNGFVRVYRPDLQQSRLLRCSVQTAAEQLVRRLGVGPLYVQSNAYMTRKLAPSECPLKLQNEHLRLLGYDDDERIQDEGKRSEIGHFIRFIVGKLPSSEALDRVELSSVVYVKELGTFSRWNRRLCILIGTRLLIFPSTSDKGRPHIFHLANGSVQELRHRKRQQCLLLTCAAPSKKILLSLGSWHDYTRWLKQCQKAIQRLPNEADLTCCSLECIPEHLFSISNLSVLNLCRNFMKERPLLDEQRVGYINDLNRFSNLRTLQLADNNLETFPLTIYYIVSLTDLNVSKNRLKELPAGIGELQRLQTLQLHTNMISNLPDDIAQLKRLTTLMIAFNNFSELPAVVFQLKHLQILIATGNNISQISDDVKLLRSLQQLDLRLNYVTSLPVDSLMRLKSLSLLDMRDNCLTSLESSKLNTIQLLHVGNNQLRVLVLNGGEMKYVVAPSNQLISFQMPMNCFNLVQLVVSRNSLTMLPEELCDLPCLELIDASHNELGHLPVRIFWNMTKLHTLYVDHNKLTQLSDRIDKCQIEVLSVQYNRLTLLPPSLLLRFYKLRYFNASTNLLMSIPVMGARDVIYNIEELYLSCNGLKDSAMLNVVRYKKLRIFHIAFNRIKNIQAKTISGFTQLEELNVAGNLVKSLPDCFNMLPRLHTLVAHTNLLTSLPDFSQAKSLKFLDVGCNKLSAVENAPASISHCHYVDLSGNHNLVLDHNLISALKNVKQVLLEGVPIGDETVHLLSTQTHYGGTPVHRRWTHGSAEYRGNRPKLAGAQVKVADFGHLHDGLYAVFDGGMSPESSTSLAKTFSLVLIEELNQQKQDSNPGDYMKQTFLSAHKLLRMHGRRTGAAAAACHIRTVEVEGSSSRGYLLTVGNVGHTEVLLCREGQVHVVTTKHTTSSNVSEQKRIRERGGFITEDNKVNGLSVATRLLGCNYLSPWVVPCPSVVTIPLTPQDEFLILGCGGLWRYVSYNQAAAEVRKQLDPIVAAKRLRDLARSYGSSANISVIIVRFNLQGIALASIEPQYRVTLSPPRKPRYRWSMIGLNNLTSGDSISELNDVSSLSRLHSASYEWTASRGSSATELGGIRHARTLPRRDSSLRRERQNQFVRQAVLEKDSESEENDEANETHETLLTTVATDTDRDPFGDEGAVDHADNTNRFSLTFVPNTTNPFAKRTSLTFDANSEGSKFQFTTFDMDDERNQGWTTTETELTNTLAELKELQTNAMHEDTRPRSASVTVMQHQHQQHNLMKPGELLTVSETNSSVHIPELDELDRTLSMIGREVSDED